MEKAFMIAACGSNSGKTTITCGLLKAFADAGLRLHSYKCGPDYIDPLFHEKILGVTCRNLDLFFTDEITTRKLFLTGEEADLSIVEGVMGLYDGLSPERDTASSYHLARTLQIPVFLTVNAKGMGRSLLAVIRGFLEMDTAHRIRGVILNRITEGYYKRIAPVIEKELSLPVLGFLPQIREGTVESRYLGLKLPEEICDIQKSIDVLGKTITKTFDLKRMLELSSEISKEPPAVIQSPIQKKLPIAVARDEAFCFYYHDNLRLLEEAGAELIYFSPIHDKKLPENIGGVIFGGGYPELFAEKLSRNRSMLLSVRDALSGGLPSLAECGGFMYLHDAIVTEDHKRYPMCGMISGDCFYTGRLVRFGYISLEEKTKAFLPGSSTFGSVIRGHEFHYFDSEENGSDVHSNKPAQDRCWSSSFTANDHWWGFAHLYYPSNPDFPKNFVHACKEYLCDKTGIIST